MAMEWDQNQNFNDDQKLSDGPYAFSREYKCWRPLNEHSLTTEEAYYCADKISRGLHMDDFKDAYQEQTIIKKGISEDTHSSLPEGLEGSWFGIAGDRDQHTWYGNVACEIGINKFLNTFKPECYFAEIVEYATKSAPRLLLTTQGLPDGLDLPECNRASKGGPWYIDDAGQHHFPSKVRRFRTGHLFNQCDVEMFVVLSDKEYKHLYQLCDKLPANHSCANDPGPMKCKKFRAGRKQGFCGYAWSIEECAVEIQRLKDEQE